MNGPVFKHLHALLICDCSKLVVVVEGRLSRSILCAGVVVGADNGVLSEQGVADVAVTRKSWKTVKALLTLVRGYLLILIVKNECMITMSVVHYPFL